MIKDFTTVFLLVLFGLLGKITEWLGYDIETQTLFYELGVTMIVLTLAIHILTEVKGNRVYIWLGMVFLAGMNPVNLIFNDLKLTLPIVLISYVAAFAFVYLYRKFKVR